MDEEKKIAALLIDPLKEKGYDLYELHYHPGANARLEIIVDRPDPIGLDEIVDLSNELSALLDAADPIEEAYTLDISSAGAEKRIDPGKLELYLGRHVHLHLTHPYKGENILEGKLVAASENEISLEVAQKSKKLIIALPRQDIDKARLAVAF
ncbi:MAG: ribosome maturation factor RimP [Bacilli bacterium]|nr:ribosome maturation factor RimP [Bacilli bacterium]